MTLNNADGEKWMITKPYQAPARTVEMDEFLVSLRKWRIAGYADTAILDDAAMGLTNPSSTLIVTDREGNTQTAVFGRSAETTTFVRIGGKDEVVLLYNTDIDFSMMDADTLLFVAPFKMAVDQVASIRVSVSTGDYLFEIDPATGLVKCNGQYIDEKDFTGIFFKYISLNADGADLSQVVKPGEAVAYLKTVKLDGTEVEMTLYGRNEGTCYMELNGEMIYYLETAKMVGLLERIEAALQK